MKTRESAVSPVIGVMLMLTITVLLAAIVSSYAGSMGSQAKEAPPSASVQAGVIKYNVTFDHLGGDAFKLTDVSVSLYNETSMLMVHENLHKYAAETGTTDNSVIRAGERFFIWGVRQGSTSNFSVNESSPFRFINITPNDRIQWRLIDRNSQKMIASGIFIPEP